MEIAFAAIKSKLNRNCGVWTFRLGDVVRASPSGFERCTEPDIHRVIEQLKDEGIAIYSSDLRTNQNTLIRLYYADSPVKKIVDAVLFPTEQNDDIVRCVSALVEARAVFRKYDADDNC